MERSFTPVEAWERRPGAAHRRREPEKTLLHAVVRERLEPFLAAARDVHAGTACCLGEGAPAGA